MTVVIDRDEALALLDRAVAEKGEDYVYPSFGAVCTYASGGQPSCIVGHVLNYKGIAPAELRVIDDLENGYYVNGEYIAVSSTAIRNIVGYLKYEFDFELTLQALETFAIAQRDQDNGMTWGQSVASARELVAA